MAKDANGNDIPDKSTTGGTGDDQHIPKARFDEVIGQKNDLKKQLDEQGKTLADLLAKNKTAEDARLAEQGQYKELTEKQKVQLSQVEQQLAALKPYQERVGALVEAEIKALPEAFRDLVPEGNDPLAKLDFITKLKGKPELFPSGHGTPPGGPKPAGGGMPQNDATKNIAALQEEFKGLENRYDQQSLMRKVQITDQLNKLSKGT